MALISIGGDSGTHAVLWVLSQPHTTRFRRGKLGFLSGAPGFPRTAQPGLWGALYRHRTGLGDMTDSIFTQAWEGVFPI